MNIQNFGTLQMVRTNNAHFGQTKVQQPAGAPKTFESFLMEAVNTVNSQQLDVTKVQEQLITNPDEVDVHDVTIAMSKAQMSLNLAQTVIDRIVTSWNEISTTR